MSFLDEFDRRAKGGAPGGPRKDAGPPPAGETPEDRELLDFADLVRERRAVPDEAGRRRVLERVRAAERARPRTGLRPYFGPMAIAAGLLIASGLLAFFKSETNGTGSGRIAPPHSLTGRPGASGPRLAARKPSIFANEFAGLDFPQPEPQPVQGAGRAEKPSGLDRARVLGTSGLVMIQRKGESRWRLLSRGAELLPGDTVRASRRLESGAQLLGPDGSRATVAWGAELAYDGPRAWRLSAGRAHFKVAKRPDLPAFTVATPDGAARALGTEFLLAVEPPAADRKAATLCWVGAGRVALSGAERRELDLGPGKAGRLSGGQAVGTDWSGEAGWLRTLESEANADHGVGELLARVVDGKTPAQPLEIKSHRVTVTVVDQVARTFIDEEFANNTSSRMEGTFYYPLPPDAAVSEFAMYVDGVRVEGEVLEQHRARQIFEYIVRQQRDPALLEFAGGNLFKMRIFPIEPHSTKRIQLGYTQILPRREGLVTYSYPLVSEKLLKNPLRELSIDFRVLSSYGLAKLESPTHEAATALSSDGLRGALAFRARDYSPTRDFAVTYRVPSAPECAVFGNRPKGMDDNFLMLQLCPRAELPSRPSPTRLLVVVDGSASAGAQDYAVAGELASSAADIACGLQFAVLRGGSRPELFGSGFAAADGSLSGKVREFLAGRPPMGATDLVATFRAAAAAVRPGERVQLLYVGDGVETVSELEGAALVNAILRLFEGRDVEISCAAVGASYDRGVLAGLAAATGGVFVRVEGAADVHAAAGQILDGFYLPVLRDVRVEIEGLKAFDVYPATAATLVQGDTLVVLARAGRTGRGKVTLTGNAEGGRFERRYGVDFEADAERNRFLPRLWAKAHIDHFISEMGLGGAEEDARLRGKVIENSVYYQIMSPFTAFLVLESEGDYAKFGIKRQGRLFDWKGGEDGIFSTAKGPQGQPAGMGKEWGALPAKLMPYPGPMNPGEDAKSEYVRDWVEISQRTMVPQSKLLIYPRDWDGYGLTDLDSDGGFIYDSSQSMDRKKLFNDVNKLTFELPNFPGPEMELREGELGRLRLRDDLPMIGRVFREDGRHRIDSEYSRSSGKHYWSGGRYSQAQYVSPILSAGAVVGLKVDQPLQPSAVYRRMAARGEASLTSMLNLALALGQEGRLAEAIVAIEAVVAKLPELPDLWLELGALRHRSGDAEGARKAFAKALELAPEKDREAIHSRIAGFYSNVNDYRSAAEWFEALARAGGSDPAKVPAHLANAATQWRNCGDEPRARAALTEAAGLCEKLGRAAAAANPEKAAGHFSSAASLLGDAGETARARELWLEAAACHEKLARSAGGDEHQAAGLLSMAVGWLRSAGEPVRAQALSARCAEAFAKQARAAAKPEEAQESARRAAKAWHDAGEPRKALAAWDEAVARFPDSAPLKLAAGSWLSDCSVEPDRAAELLAQARSKGHDVGDRIFNTLLRAGRRKEALVELRRLTDASKDQNQVYQRLSALHSWGGTAMRDEIARLLTSGSPVLVGGALVTVQNYSFCGNKPVQDALAAALASPGFPAEARLNAFMVLIRSGRRELAAPGGRSVSVVTVLDPLFTGLDKPERRGLAVQGVQYLSGQGFAKEALARSRELLARRDLDEASRTAVLTTEIGALQTLGRSAEALEKLKAFLAAAKDEAAAANAAWQIWQQYVARGEYEEAAKVAADFARRFPDSNTARAFDHNLLSHFMNSGQREEAGKLSARQVRENPGNAIWVRTHVNFLASDGKFEEAAATLRACLRLNPEPAAAPAPIRPAAGAEKTAAADRARLVEEATKDVRRMSDRHGLIALLARVAAQDAGLRAAFLKEADEAAKGEDRELRSWTEGTLACLAEAADTEALVARLEKLAAAEPGWLERLARAHLSSGEDARAAAAYEQLLKIRPDRADVMVALAELALRRKDAKAAESWRSRALDLLARTPNALYYQAYAWHNAGRNEWALEAWKRLAAKGPYARDGQAAWNGASLARALNRPKEEAALLFQAALAYQGNYAQPAIARLGEMLGDAAAGPAARPVAIELLGECMARLGKSSSALDWQVNYLGGLAQRMNRFADAAALYIRAFETAGGSYASAAQNQLRGLIQNPQAQKVARPMAEEALDGWLRSPEKLSSSSAWAAAELAQFLDRPDAAIRLAAQVARSGQGSAFGTAQFMANLADTPARRSAAEAELREALSGKSESEAAIWTGSLDFLLAWKRGEAPAARAALDRLVAARIGAPNHALEVLNALAYTGEKDRDRLVEYALKGGGDLDENWRRNLLQQAVNSCGGSDAQVLRLHRALIGMGGNVDEDRRQLIEALVRLDRLDEAAAELHGLELEAGHDASYVYQEWTRVVDAFMAKNTAESQHRAIELAVDGWERLSRPEDQSYYGQNMLAKLLDLCAAADKQGRIDTSSVRRKVAEALLSSVREWFASGAGGGQRWNAYIQGNRSLEKEGLLKETDDLARQAVASDDASRVARAAQYWQGRNMVGEAKQAWRRVLRLAGANESTALTQLYSLSAHLIPQEWDSALGYLDRLGKFGVYTGDNYLMERARCLYGLKRTKEAREAVGRLLASSAIQLRNGNYYWCDSVAQICEAAGDWKTAAEAWEASIRVWRWLSERQPGSYWPNLVAAYERAARAYAEAGEGGKSLECYLRGLSVIPRDQSGYYQNLLNGALTQLLKGQALDQAVAEYEKAVAGSGGAEKPHLRIAFGEAYRREGKTLEMLRQLAVAADLLPKDMALRAQVIEGYKQLKDEKAAVAAYLAWAKVDQQNLELWKGLGDYYDSLGKKDEAMTAWATMAEVRPREAEGYRAYAGKLSGAGLDDAAAAALRKAVRYRPTNFDVAKELAEVYRRLKQEKAAADLWVSGEKACRQAMEDFADDPTPWLSLGKFLTAQGKKEEAREVYRKILGRSWPRFQNETHPEASRLLGELQ